MFLPRALVVALVGCLLGCQARIQHGLDERQANELLTVLADRGITAEKVQEDGKKPTWSIEVGRDQAASAVRVLAELDLPKHPAPGFSEVFGQGSLVPTPTEERAMYVQALSGEVARTLESLEGVVSARVHLVLPPPSRPGSPAPFLAKASAFLRVRPGARERLGSQDKALRELVSGSVEGLNPDMVTLLLDEIPGSRGPPVPLVDSGTVGLKRAVLCLSIALAFLVGTLLWIARKLGRGAASTRKTVPVSLALEVPRKAA
jgi:type III secretion protein J